MPRNRSERLGPDQARKIAEECYGEVLAYCKRHAPSGHEAADLAQETFLRFVRAQGYAKGGKPIAYLMRVARSVCVDASREKHLETVHVDFDVPDEAAGADPVGAASLEASLEAHLDEALAQMPGDLREVVELHFGAGLGVVEVGKVLGISRFAVRRRLDTALKMLGQMLGKELKEGKHYE